MKRRDFIKNIAITTGGLLASPRTKLRSIKMTDPRPVRAAHVENDRYAFHLEDLYIRPAHAETARRVHEKAASKAASKPIPVSLIKLLIDESVSNSAEQLKGVDVFSVSSQYTDGAEPPSMTENIPQMQDFWKSSDAIGVFAAGNKGNESSARESASIDIFSDTCVVVGEADKHKENRTWFIENHSSLHSRTTFLSPNITDETNPFPSFLLKPDLTGHEDLIKNFLTRRGMLETKESPPYYRFPKEIHDNFEYLGKSVTSENYSEILNKLTQDLMTNPEPLHRLMKYELAASCQNCTYNNDGFAYATNQEGTSFCAPYVAGLFTYAKQRGFQREAEQKRALSSEELIAVAITACQPVRFRYDTSKLESPPNSRGLPQNSAAGFGVLTAEFFKKRLNEAYQVLDTNPALVTTVKTQSFEGFTKTAPPQDEEYNLTIPESQDATILKTRIQFKGTGTPPPFFEIVNPKGQSYFIPMSEVGNAKTQHSWGVTDRMFGENLAGNWKIRPYYTEDPGKNRFMPDSIIFAVHGVEKGGLVDTLIDQKLGVSTPTQSPILTPTIKNRGR